jgi:tetratricopeptide (TPR) repeat protein
VAREVDRLKLSREVWLQVEPLLSTALDMESGERDAWVRRLEAGHPDIVRWLQRMLQRHDRAERSSAHIAAPTARCSAGRPGAHGPGSRIGPFELTRPLGRGGMGEVWLAAQADGRVARDVALKLPATNRGGEAWRDRFGRERDILARLEHRHIARLYDAGITPQGEPWLAMEYVAGHTLLEHSAARPLRERLGLFRQVLAAVAHAHRHLVVHRDLKPANILVDAAGQVKLLDFGIARLLDDPQADEGGEDLMRQGGGMMTLRYAAPEQVACEPLTTAADVYSLGVILHELATGQSPYRAVREGGPLVAAMVLREEAASRPPRRALAGDLDAIVRKAMRRRGSDRYASVELFDADVVAFLERRPVKARSGTWRYLAGRFAARHKLPLAMACAVLITLVGGLFMAEAERRRAVAERDRAERHFASVRRLANTFVFDVDGEIEHLAGALKARRILVGTALEYLDSLAGESHDDPGLALEMASAYRRLAEIGGDSRGAHLGDPAGARRNAERAAALLAAIEAREPANRAALREHRIVLLLLGRLRLESGDASGVGDTAKAVAIAERAAALPGAAIDDRRNLGATLAEHGGILAVVVDDPTAAAAQLGRAIGYLEALVAENPGDVPARASLAYAYERGAMGVEAAGSPEQLPRAAHLLGRSVAVTESIVRDDPMSVSHTQTLVKRYNNSARVNLRVGDVGRARADAARAHALVARLAAADPRNVGNATMLAGVLSMASHIEYRDGRFERAIELARQSIAADNRLPAEVRAGLIVRENAVEAKRSLGASACLLPPRSMRLALIQEAQLLLAESRGFKQELVTRGIDAREAQGAIREIDADLRRCGAAIARLKSS